MIKINRNKKAIQIGELVIVKKWVTNKGYVYSDRIGIVMADEGVDELGQEQWGRWHVALENGDYIGCSSNEIEVIQEVDDGSDRTTALSENH
tara:strand:+ start:2598 stop:2873 length:276 start_codon:yes stop_codon:yes gene_type:complete